MVMKCEEGRPPQRSGSDRSPTPYNYIFRSDPKQKIGGWEMGQRKKTFPSFSGPVPFLNVQPSKGCLLFSFISSSSVKSRDKFDRVAVLNNVVKSIDHFCIDIVDENKNARPERFATRI